MPWGTTNKYIALGQSLVNIGTFTGPREQKTGTRKAVTTSYGPKSVSFEIVLGGYFEANPTKFHKILVGTHAEVWSEFHVSWIYGKPSTAFNVFKLAQVGW